MDRGEGELRIEKFGAERAGFHVLSTMIMGPTEMILWDGQYKVSDGKRLAEAVAATGRHLKAIILSHADHDHYMAAAELIERFPGTPVYMTQAGLDDYERRSQDDLAMEQKRGGPEVPDSIVVPQLLPSGILDVDGHELEIIEGLTGDVRAEVSSALWIPELRTILAGDLVFDGIHAWLGDADAASRAEWRRSLGRLAALDPIAVVPGHKRDLSRPDSPDQIDFMIQYLTDYDTFMEEASEPADVEKAMRDKYPNLAIPGLMAYGARTLFKR